MLVPEDTRATNVSIKVSVNPSTFMRTRESLMFSKSVDVSHLISLVYLRGSLAPAWAVTTITETFVPFCRTVAFNAMAKT